MTFLHLDSKDKTRKGIGRQEGMESDSTKGGEKDDPILLSPKPTRLVDKYLKKDKPPRTIQSARIGK